MNQSLFIILIGAMLGATACSKANDKAVPQAVVEQTVGDQVQRVDTMTVHAVPFKSDIVSNGRVHAAETADVFFRSAELIDKVWVHNGRRVRRGEPLARIDIFKLEAEKKKQEAAVASARLELKDVLIGQGYDPDDANIPAKVLKLARVRSGLEQAEANYNSTLRDIDNATLTAPFDGVVANVAGAPHTMASTAEPFCTIVNDSRMDVEFPVIESEFASVHKGDIVEIAPYSSNDTYTGRIVEINPMVDKNGQITVKATLDSRHHLIDGLSVKVRMSRLLSNRIVVPKRAVVIRSDRKVVFTYADGKALWNYVSTGLENLDSYEITEGLNEGDIIIVGGCENLAHESPVTVD